MMMNTYPLYLSLLQQLLTSFSCRPNKLSKMAPKKGLVGKDAFARMNFLYQASALCSSFSSEKFRDLGAYYGTILRNVGKKALLRAEPEMKRTLCKGCNALLSPGENVKVRLHKKPSPRIVWTCSRCFTIKRFGVKKDHKTWLEQKEAVIETNTFSNNKSNVTGESDSGGIPVEIEGDKNNEKSLTKTVKQTE